MRTAHSKKAADEPHVGLPQACGSRGFVPAGAGNPGPPDAIEAAEAAAPVSVASPCWRTF